MRTPKPKHFAAFLLAGLAFPASGFAGELGGFQLALSTAHFDYYARPGGRKLKTSDAQKAERFLAVVQDHLGQRVTGRVEYYYLDHAADLAALTGTYAEGVTDSATLRIESLHAFHPHEIVHRVALELGDPGQFFHEGLAVALAAEGESDRRRIDENARVALGQASLLDYLERFDRLPPAQAYAAAGAFVAYLMEQHGQRALADFFRACGRDPRRRETAFLRTFGRSLKAVAEEWSRSRVVMASR